MSKHHQRICPTCNGKRYVLNSGVELCSGCTGTGKDTTAPLWAGTCPYCGGTGKQPFSRYEPCKTCGSMGIVKY